MVRSITFLEAGATAQLEKFVNPKTGKWRKIRFPSTVAMIEHSTAGYLLFDTGYTPRFLEKTRYFPERIYSLITPVHIPEEETAVGRLRSLGIKASDVNHVILSHFHADHIAGAADFTRAHYHYSYRELGYFKSRSHLSQVKHGFIAGLLPEDLTTRGLPADSFPIPLPMLGQGWMGQDLLSDGSIFLVPLPGHTLGQIGMYLPEVCGKSYLLVADAAWLGTSFRDHIAPSPIAQAIFYDRQQYASTLGHLHQTFCAHQHDPSFRILTCHCESDLKEEQGDHA